MLAEEAIWVAALTTVISASGFALEDVGPEFHDKKRPGYPGLSFFGSPG